MTVFSATADVFTTDRYRDDYLVQQLMSSLLTGTVMTMYLVHQLMSSLLTGTVMTV